MPSQPTTFAEYIDAIRAELVCERCRRYVGSLDRRRYLPPPYAVAVGRPTEDDDESSTLISFEWHMVGLLRAGNFTIRHPEQDGRCMSYREWVAIDEDDDPAPDVDAAEGSPA